MLTCQLSDLMISISLPGCRARRARHNLDIEPSLRYLWISFANLKKLIKYYFITRIISYGCCVKIEENDFFVPLRAIETHQFALFYLPPCRKYIEKINGKIIEKIVLQIEVTLLAVIRIYPAPTLAQIFQCSRRVWLAVICVIPIEFLHSSISSRYNFAVLYVKIPFP